MEKKDIDYAGIDYKAFSKGIISELESATGAADEIKAAQLQTQKAKLDDQIAKLQLQKANLQKQIDDIEKK
jgi:hypothetical protein